MKQKDVEAQLEDFVHENERIRMQILERDRLAQELRDKAQRKIAESSYRVRQSSPQRNQRDEHESGSFDNRRGRTSPLRDSPPNPRRTR